MTPDQLSKSNTEHAHQVAFFAYCNVARLYGFERADVWAATGEVGAVWNKVEALPMLRWIHAIPNGGTRGDDHESAMIRGAALKAEGVKSGIADTFLPYPVSVWSTPATIYHGLYIEFKKPALKPKRDGKGGVSQEQEEFRNWCYSVRYGWAVCYSWREAVDILKRYIRSNIGAPP